MNRLSRVLLKCTSATSILLMSSNALAGGVGTIALTLNGPTAVPSLSGSMLIVLSLLLFAVAFKVAKQKNAGKLFMTLMGVTVLSTGLGGMKLVSDSFATGFTLNQSNYSIGETRNIDLDVGTSHIINMNTSPMSIGGITSDPGYSCFVMGAGRTNQECVGTLPAGNTCRVQCDAIGLSRGN